MQTISLSVSLNQLQFFSLIFLRVIAILMTIPIFKSKSLPILFKAGLAMAISIVLFPILNLDGFPVLANVIDFAIGAIGEILLGITIGLAVNLLFAGLQLAGQLAGYQMGMALANVMDPATSEQIPLLAQFNYIFALLLFAITNAHHWFLRALAESYRLVPPFNFQFSSSLMEQFVHLAGNMFIIAIKVGAPVIAALLLTSIAFGLIARTVPQMNVFFVAMPLKIVIGLLFMGFSLPFLATFLKEVYSGLGETILRILKAIP
jgi:flagellar biosynthetic protein FliR